VILMAVLYHIQPFPLRRRRRRQLPGRYGHPVVALDAVRRSKQRGGSGGGSVQRAALECSFPASFIEARLRRLDLQHTSQISDLAKRNEQCEETGIHPHTNAPIFARDRIPEFDGVATPEQHDYPTSDDTARIRYPNRYAESIRRYCSSVSGPQLRVPKPRCAASRLRW